MTALLAPPQIDEHDIRLGGLRMHYRTWGSGPPVYVLHGGPGGSGSYWPHALPFLGATHTVVAPDLRGHGLSGRRPPYTIERLADDILELADALGHDRFSLLGHSFGAPIGMCAATGAARIDRLVLVGGFAASWQVLARPHGLSTKARLGARVLGWNVRLRLGRAPPIRDLLRTLLREARPLLHPGAQAEEIERVLWDSVVDPLDAVVPLQRELLRWDHLDRLEDIRCPTLVVVGAHDTLSRPLAARLAEGLSDARLVEIPDAGHSPFFDRPQRFDQTLVSFLDGA